VRPLPRYARRRLAGWGSFPVEECDVYRPERREQLQEVVARAPQRSLVARGRGRAYGDSALNAGEGVILSERLDRMLDFDAGSGVLWCESAVTLSEILDVFLPQGFFLPVTPGTKHISLGGAIAADVHGKNHHHSGALASFLESFHLLLASGEILDCSRERNPDAFWATIGGMGLTGVVLDARLRLKQVENAYVAVDCQKLPDLDAMLESFLLHDASFEYSVAWVDCLARGASLGRGVIMRASHARADELPARARRHPWKIGHLPAPSVPFVLPDATVNRTTARAVNALYRAMHRNGRSVSDCNSFFYPLDSIGQWNRVYGRRGVIQYQMVVPPETAREALVEILGEVSAAQCPIFLAVLKPFGAADAGLLSFPRPGHTLALDMPLTGPDLLELVARLDAIVVRHGGAVYLAKDSCLDPELLESMYPALGRFREVKAKLDPDLRFSSSQARRLRIVEEG